jgi:hypothetical protein
MTLNPQEQVEMALKWCDIVSDDPPYEWEKHAKVLAKEVRRLLEREKALVEALMGCLRAGGCPLCFKDEPHYLDECEHPTLKTFIEHEIKKSAALSVLNPGENGD